MLFEGRSRIPLRNSVPVPIPVPMPESIPDDLPAALRYHHDAHVVQLDGFFSRRAVKEPTVSDGATTEDKAALTISESATISDS